MAIPFVDLLVERLPSIPHVLNAGTDATIHWLADAAEDTLSSFVPAYAIAKTQAILLCASGGKSSADCSAFINQLKYRAMDELARLTGLRSIIAAIIAAWKKIPEVIRNAIADGGEALQKVTAIIADVGSFAAGIVSFDPDKLLASLKDAPTLLYSAGVSIYNAALGTTASVLTMWKDKGQKLADLVDVPGLHEIATGLIDLATIPLYVLGKAAELTQWFLNELLAKGAKWVMDKISSGVNSALGGSAARDLDLVVTASRWVNICTSPYSFPNGNTLRVLISTGFDRATGKTMEDFVSSEVGHLQDNWWIDPDGTMSVVTAVACLQPDGGVLMLSPTSYAFTSASEQQPTTRYPEAGTVKQGN